MGPQPTQWHSFTRGWWEEVCKAQREHKEAHTNRAPPSRLGIMERAKREGFLKQMHNATNPPAKDKS